MAKSKTIDGRAHAKRLLETLEPKIRAYTPALTLLDFENTGDWHRKFSERFCKNSGIECDIIRLKRDTSQRDVNEIITGININPKINGILTILPLPPHLDMYETLSAIDPLKDIDCQSPYNLGLAMMGNPNFVSGTALSVAHLLEKEGITTDGKHVVIVGRSVLVGRPLAALLCTKNATVTVCHTKTNYLSDYTKQADILAVAAGSPNLITGDMIKEGAVVIDIGNTEGISKNPVGDIDFESCEKKASFITPTPGGVGPMTVALLISNLIKAWEVQND